MQSDTIYFSGNFYVTHEHQGHAFPGAEFVEWNVGYRVHNASTNVAITSNYRLKYNTFYRGFYSENFNILSVTGTINTGISGVTYRVYPTIELRLAGITYLPTLYKCEMFIQGGPHWVQNTPYDGGGQIDHYYSGQYVDIVGGQTATFTSVNVYTGSFHDAPW